MMNNLISRQWLIECVEEGWIKFETEKDKKHIYPFGKRYGTIRTARSNRRSSKRLLP